MYLTFGERCALSKKDKQSGFTLIETMISMSVMLIAVAGLVSSILMCVKLRQTNEEKAKARNAAEQTFSAIRGMSGIVDAYNRFGGGRSEETFSVSGLSDPSATEQAGRIIIWRLKDSLKDRTNPPNPDPDSSLAFSQTDIRDAQNSFSSSFPNEMESLADTPGINWTDFIDTNGDSLVNSGDSPQLMPVTLRLRWRTRTGMTTQYFSALIGQR